MKLGADRARLMEKDIEDWLFENPKAIETPWDDDISEWVGRQYKLPSGIADLIGVSERGILVVVEVKNVPLDKAAITQVCRYASDLESIADLREDYPRYPYDTRPQIMKILVGPSMDSQTFTEARACGVWVQTFEVELELTLNSLRFNKAYLVDRTERFHQIARQPEWERFGKYIDGYLHDDDLDYVDDDDLEVSVTMIEAEE